MCIDNTRDIMMLSHIVYRCRVFRCMNFTKRHTIDSKKEGGGMSPLSIDCYTMVVVSVWKNLEKNLEKKCSVGSSTSSFLSEVMLLPLTCLYRGDIVIHQGE